MIWLTWANALSVLRLLLASPCAYAIWLGAWRSAIVLFAVAVATDIFDGIVARRRGQATPLGGLLDHSIDAIFVTTTIGALALIGVIPTLLPPLIMASFIQYVWDSKALRGAPLRASVLGRWNGVGYYALVGTVVVANALSLGWPAPGVLNALGWLLILSTLISMGDRAFALRRVRRAR